MAQPERCKRVVIENVRPAVDDGRFPAKRSLGEPMDVTADVFTDGHDLVAAALLLRGPAEKTWRQIACRRVGNDRFAATFTPDTVGTYSYTIEGWVDHFASWRMDIQKKIDAGQPVALEVSSGLAILKDTCERIRGDDRKALQKLIGKIETSDDNLRRSLLLGDETMALMARTADRRRATRYDREMRVTVDPPKALFSTWYERFPRSCSNRSDRHGTFRDCEALLPEIAAMGFDVLYFPPIHPIGTTKRKGRNNRPESLPEDVGSPWAIGSAEGGHTAIHPQLGTMDDFEHLVSAAREQGIDIALDLAFQCSPDHPWVTEHPEWFRWRPDGTVQYAENPPKKYEDVLPLHFEAEAWRELWEALRDVVLFWVRKGIRIFRVDNPHTKPFPFWEWLIKEIKRDNPEVIFLSEAFARPAVMYRLGKIGFTQSYTYFTWRNTKPEFEAYLTELTRGDKRDFFRPNFWTNTPDILPEHLQYGGRPGHMMRLVLAATLSSSYGLYGPVFELLDSKALPGKEEYGDSEKYEIRNWNPQTPGNLRGFISRVNRIRRENPALQTTWNLRFLEIDNESLLAYLKTSDDGENILLVVVNLDPYHTQSGWIRVPASELGIEPDRPYLAHDLLGDGRYIWQGEMNYIQIDPSVSPAHIFRLRKRLHRESDFDYFL